MTFGAILQQDKTVSTVILNKEFEICVDLDTWLVLVDIDIYLRPMIQVPWTLAGLENAVQ